MRSVIERTKRNIEALDLDVLMIMKGDLLGNSREETRVVAMITFK